MGETREDKIAKLEERKFRYEKFEELDNRLGKELDEYESEVPVQ